jgi:hypothetical protein
VNHTSIRNLTGIAGAVLAAALLAGCTGNASPRPTVTRTVTSPPVASSAPTPTATGTGTGTGTAPPHAAARCTTDQLTGAVGERNGAQPGSGSGMNQQHVAIIVTNTGTAPCTLQGWPGVSLVGDGNGTQLGAAAHLDRSTPHPTVTVDPGGRLQAPLDYVNASVYDPAECKQATADGLRVYPPGSTTSLFIADQLAACTTTTHDLLTVGAFVSYP